MMTSKQFQRLLARDAYCLHCGETERLAPNHRVNRGMGGSKLLDRPANIVLLCSRFNGLIESDSEAARIARLHGWKLERWQVPEEVPVTDLMTGRKWLLGADWSKITVL